jgi:hypothetical protein
MEENLNTEWAIIISLQSMEERQHGIITCPLIEDVMGKKKRFK